MRWARAGATIAVAAIAGAAGYQSFAGPATTARVHPSTAQVPRAASPVLVPLKPPRRAAEAIDSAVPDGTTVFDSEVPGVAKLDPALLAALRRAATDAGGAGVDFVVDSGWRSRAYQARLFREAIAKYGSAEEAARWVATPATSPHVTGDAVDLGRTAAAWLSLHGSAYGLCQIYANEPWHFELRPGASVHGCPAMYADPTHDPRMQR